MIISQHTQKGTSSLLCYWDQGLHPRHPRKPSKEKNQRFFLYTVTTIEKQNLVMTKKETLKRQKEIKIRLTHEEHEELLNLCTTGSLASWMRETCLGEKRKKQVLDPKLLRQLSGIGNNLNQIARLMNQQSKSNSVIDRIAVITALSGIENELKRLHSDHKNT